MSYHFILSPTPPNCGEALGQENKIVTPLDEASSEQRVFGVEGV
jgi:hypothetical protein